MNKILLSSKKKAFIILTAVVAMSIMGACASKKDMSSNMDMRMEQSMSENMNEKKMDSEIKGEMSEERMDSEMKGEMNEEKMDSDKMKATNMSNTDMKGMNLELQDFEGNTITLGSYSGKKVYVKYWASWCSICLAGLEELNTLAGQKNDFEVVTVVSPGVRGEKDKESFKKWFAELGYQNIKVLFDEDGKLAKEYGVVAYPTSIYINSDSTVSETRVGHNDNKMIKDVILDKVM